MTVPVVSRPNEDLEQVRRKLPTDMRSRGDCPERAGVCWCSQNAAHDALDRVQARQQQLEDALMKIADGRWNRGTDGYMSAREFARVSLRALAVSGGRENG